jgi:hypothetical protein
MPCSRRSRRGAQMLRRTRPSSAPAVSILDALADPQLFGAAFQGDSWRPWRAPSPRSSGCPWRGQLDVFRGCSGRRDAPTRAAREAWCIAGRRGGKSRIAAAVAVYLAAFRTIVAFSPAARATCISISDRPTTSARPSSASRRASVCHWPRPSSCSLSTPSSLRIPAARGRSATCRLCRHRQSSACAAARRGAARRPDSHGRYVHWGERAPSPRC